VPLAAGEAEAHDGRPSPPEVGPQSR
jgi:hypothetical protein